MTVVSGSGKGLADFVDNEAMELVAGLRLQARRYSARTTFASLAKSTLVVAVEDDRMVRTSWGIRLRNIARNKAAKLLPARLVTCIIRAEGLMLIIGSLAAANSINSACRLNQLIRGSSYI